MPFLYALGLTQGGCKLAARLVTGSRPGQAVFELPAATEIDGWFFLTSNEPADFDPIRYTWESLDVQRTAWKELRYPPWLPRDAVEGSPSSRVSVKSVDFRAPWLWTAVYVVGLLCSGLANLTASVLGKFGYGRAGILLMGWVYLVYAVVFTAAAMGDLGSGGGMPMVIKFVLFAVAAGLAGVNLLLERYSVDLFLLQSTALCAARALEGVLNFPAMESMVLYWFTMMLYTALPLLASIAMVVARSVLRTWVFGKQVHCDRYAFSVAWVEALRCDAAALAGIRVAIRQHATDLPPGPVRQCLREQRVIPRVAWARLIPWRWAAASNESVEELERPVITSLDQLYYQAACADFFLRRKVKSWALASHGCFQMAPSERESKELRFRRWADILSKNEVVDVEWTPIKRPERSLEKLVRFRTWGVLVGSV